MSQSIKRMNIQNGQDSPIHDDHVDNIGHEVFDNL